jgi:hypothetical protein
MVPTCLNYLLEIELPLDEELPEVRHRHFRNLAIRHTPGREGVQQVGRGGRGRLLDGGHAWQMEWTNQQSWESVVLLNVKRYKI